MADSLSPTSTPEVDERQLRPFYSPEKTRQAIFDNVLTAFQNKFPMENDYVRIEAKNWRYDPAKLSYGISQTKDAILKGNRLATPLYADVKLINKQSGETLDERKGHLMANVPYLTDRGVFVMKGVQYVTFNQTRLRPGIYTRVQESGDVEAHINVKSGTGQGMRMFMEPETGIFRLKIGDSKVKLYPILRQLGVSDDEISAAWGQKVFEVNRDAADRKAFGLFYDGLVGTRGPRLLDVIRQQGIRKTASGMSEGLDEEKVSFYQALTDALAPGHGQESPEFVNTMLKHGFKSTRTSDGWKYELIKQAMMNFSIEG